MKSFGLVEDKVYETDFFLEKVKYCTISFECKYYFSAFLSSSRSITFALQSSMNGINGFKEWYEKQQIELKKSSLAKRFVELRNESQKVGECRIGSGRYYNDDEGNSRVKYYFSDEYNVYAKGENPRQVLLESILKGKISSYKEDDVATQCEDYFTLLLNVIHECFKQYGAIIDPEKYYTIENIYSLGQTIEDIEEELGYPRGYTSINGFSDEKRMEILRNDVPWTKIDQIFLKYLKKARYE